MQQMPQSIENEKAILGGLLLDPSLVTTISRSVDPEDFYSDRNKVIYRAMLNLNSSGVPVDYRTLQAELEKKGEFDLSGGMAYISSLDINLPDISNLTHYATIVRERSVRRGIVEVMQSISQDSLSGELESPEALNKAETALLALRRRLSGDDKWRSISDVLSGTFDYIGENKHSFVYSGMSSIDSSIGGLQPDDYMIVAGRPSMGKSSLAITWMIHQMLSGLSPGYISLEMSQLDIGMRILSMVGRVPFTMLKNGINTLHEEDQKRLNKIREELSGFSYFVDDRPKLTFDQIAGSARRLRMKNNLDILYIDHGGLINIDKMKGDNDNSRIERLSSGVKGLAKELGIPVVMLLQLNRGVGQRANHRPNLDDLRGSGAWEQDADYVGFVYRDHYYNPSAPIYEAEFNVAKARNGPTGMIQLGFLPSIMKFTNRRKGNEEAVAA